MPKLFVQIILFMPNTYFASGSLEFQYAIVRRCQCDQPPVKSLGTESLMSALGRQELACVVTNPSPEELSTRGELAKERPFGSLCLASSRLCPTYVLPLLI